MQHTRKQSTALVVDCNKLMRSSQRLLLRDQGFIVLTAACIDEAVDTFKMRHEEIDVVVVDVRSEQHVCQRLKHIDSDVPVILLNCDGFRNRSEAGAHFAALLPKPFQIDNYLRTVQSLATS